MTGDWIDPNKRLPKAFESVQVFIPTQFPFPTVHEGYIFEKDDKPYAWYIPSLREKYPLEDFIVAWKPFSNPPEWKL